MLFLIPKWESRSPETLVSSAATKSTSESTFFARSEISDRFDIDVNDGQPPEFHVEAEPQYHIYYKTDKAKSHAFEVKYIIQK